MADLDVFVDVNTIAPLANNQFILTLFDAAGQVVCKNGDPGVCSFPFTADIGSGTSFTFSYQIATPPTSGGGSFFTATPMTGTLTADFQEYSTPQSTDVLVQ